LALFYNKIGSIISIGDLPTTNIIEPINCSSPFSYNERCILDVFFKSNKDMKNKRIVLE